MNESRFFREMTLRICGSLDIQHALERAFEVLRRALPAEAVGLGFHDPVAGCIRVVAETRLPGSAHVWPEGSREIPVSAQLLAFMADRDPDRPTTILLNRPEEAAPALRATFPGLATHSTMFLRLQIGQEEVGALLVSAAGAERFTFAQARLMDAVREPFAIAMMNARSFQELESLKDRLAEDNRALSSDLQRSVGVEVVGAEFGLRQVMEQVRQVAAWNSPVLLLGETGTGKEVIAHAIHVASPRRAGPLISLQCGAVPDSLLDSELFGHEKGAFTGAAQRTRGRFERADGGTLFLDEIGELSPEAQVKLLRVLQERRFERVGGAETLEVDVRVLAATHRDLEAMVREGSFREDLWYRLNVLPIRLPPLRLRREDIPSLVHHFVARKCREMGFARLPTVPPGELARLQAYDWPGNVRELQNLVERALILSRSERLVFPVLGARGPAPRPASGPVATMDEAIAAHIRRALEACGGQVAGPGGAAELLAMNPSTLRFRMKKLGLR